MLYALILLQKKSYFVHFTLSFGLYCGQHVKTIGCAFFLFLFGLQIILIWMIYDHLREYHFKALCLNICLCFSGQIEPNYNV